MTLYDTVWHCMTLYLPDTSSLLSIARCLLGSSRCLPWGRLWCGLRRFHRPWGPWGPWRAAKVHDVRLCHGEGLASWLFCFFLWLLVLLIFVILSSNVEYVGETHVKSTGLKFIVVQRAQKVVYSMPYCNIMYISLSVLCSHVASILTPATVAPDQNDLRCKLLYSEETTLSSSSSSATSAGTISSSESLQTRKINENNHKMPHFPWISLASAATLLVSHPESRRECLANSACSMAQWRKSLCWNVVLLDNSKVANFVKYWEMSENRVYSQWNSHFIVGEWSAKPLALGVLAYFQTHPYWEIKIMPAATSPA